MYGERWWENSVASRREVTIDNIVPEQVGGMRFETQVKG